MNINFNILDDENEYSPNSTDIAKDYISQFYEINGTSTSQIF